MINICVVYVLCVTCNTNRFGLYFHYPFHSFAHRNTNGKKEENNEIFPIVLEFSFGFYLKSNINAFHVELRKCEMEKVFGENIQQKVCEWERERERRCARVIYRFFYWWKRGRECFVNCAISVDFCGYFLVVAISTSDAKIADFLLLIGGTTIGLCWLVRILKTFTAYQTNAYWFQYAACHVSAGLECAVFHLYVVGGSGGDLTQMFVTFDRYLHFKNSYRFLSNVPVLKWSHRFPLRNAITKHAPQLKHNNIARRLSRSAEIDTAH